jgi:hypothetical protein
MEEQTPMNIDTKLKLEMEADAWCRRYHIRNREMGIPT